MKKTFDFSCNIPALCYLAPMLMTNKEIPYQVASYGTVAVIPAGTRCEPALNLPCLPNGNGRFWACPWEGMSDRAESWQRNYGFLIEYEDITDTTLDQSEPNDDMDGDHGSALASAGFGTDEDYGGDCEHC